MAASRPRRHSAQHGSGDGPLTAAASAFPPSDNAPSAIVQSVTTASADPAEPPCGSGSGNYQRRPFFWRCRRSISRSIAARRKAVLASFFSNTAAMRASVPAANFAITRSGQHGFRPMRGRIDFVCPYCRGNCKRTAMADRSRYEQNRPDAGIFDIPIQRAIFGRKVCLPEFLRSRAASTGSLRECRFLDNRCSWPSKKQRCDRALMSTRPSTTLADLLTPLPAANPFSAMRASLRR